MREVIHGIDAPLVPGLVMGDVHDAVDDGVAHIHVRGRHIDLRAQHLFAVGKLPCRHAAEQVKVLFNAPFAVGAVFAGLGQRAAVSADLVGGKIVHVGLARLDQLDRALVDKIKVFGGVVAMLPVEAQPLDILLNGLHVLHVLLRGVRVVQPQVAHAAVFLGGGEVDADRLGVTDVQIAVGLRREPGLHAGVHARGKILVDEIVNEVGSQQIRIGYIIGHTFHFLSVCKMQNTESIQHSVF